VLGIEIERGVERPAGDNVARGSPGKARVERGVVFFRRGRRELNLNVRVVLVEGWNDCAVPDIGVVVAPALDFERTGLSRGQPGKQGRNRDCAVGPRVMLCHALLLIR
jgi:hypothetical protein